MVALGVACVSAGIGAFEASKQRRQADDLRGRLAEIQPRAHMLDMYCFNLRTTIRWARRDAEGDLAAQRRAADAWHNVAEFDGRAIAPCIAGNENVTVDVPMCVDNDAACVRRGADGVLARFRPIDLAQP